MTPPPSQTEELLEEVGAGAKYSAYPQYSPTGTDWLPFAPSHWQTKRLRYAVDEPKKSEARTLSEDTLVSFVPMESVDEFGGLETETTRPMIEVLNGYTYFRDGDVLIAKITPCFENGKGALAEGLVNGIGFGTTELHVIRPTAQVDGRYLLYLTLGEDFRQLGTAEMYGAGGQKRVPDSFIRELRHPLPPLNEQRAIAAFLDRETARVDELIAKKQRLIELLEEKRTALIGHAVTKGLNYDAPMRDSGIEWFGNVPEHWEITRLGWVSEEVSDINHEMPPSAPDGVAFLSAKDLRDDGTLNFTDSIKQISEDDYERLARKSRPRRGDIIYSRIGACLGKARLVEVDERFLVSYSCCVVRVNPRRANRRFFRHLLDAEMVLTEAKMRTQGIGVPDLGLREICRFPVPLPPLKEQCEIADYLDGVEATLRSLSMRISDGMGQLREYRSALISAAVTGKIDVRNEVTHAAV